MYAFFRSLLFHLEPEQAHGLTMNLIRLAGAISPLRWLVSKWFSSPSFPVQAFGLTFKNPVGLAGGYDKDGLGWRGLVCLGFGHIEIGTVTPLPQPGNPKPRVFRLVEDQALINRMGFPGRGAASVARQLERPRQDGTILGVNIGKNKDTPLEEAAGDYVRCMRALGNHADYLAVNVSSPNTEGLRKLQGGDALTGLLSILAHERQGILAQRASGLPLPVLVKLAPDLSSNELDVALQAVLDTGMDGVIATNTTLQRVGLQSSAARQAGGLSGAPLFAQSLEMVRQIHLRTQGRLPVIGAGGIMNAEHARRMLDAGAVLLQVYTGLVYRGPGLVKEIVTGLQR